MEIKLHSKFHAKDFKLNIKATTTEVMAIINTLNISFQILKTKTPFIVLPENNLSPAIIAVFLKKHFGAEELKEEVTECKTIDVTKKYNVEPYDIEKPYWLLLECYNEYYLKRQMDFKLQAEIFKSKNILLTNNTIH